MVLKHGTICKLHSSYHYLIAGSTLPIWFVIFGEHFKHWLPVNCHHPPAKLCINIKKKQNHPAGTNNSWATYSCYQNTTSLIQLVDVAWLAFQRQRSGGNQSSRDRVRACPWSRELLASKAEDAVEMPGNDGKPAVYVGFHWANHLIIRKRALPLPALSTKSGAPSDSGSANSSRDEWLV